MHEWQSPRHLADHFRKHGRRMGLRTVEEFDASARATIAKGTIFGYEDDRTGEWRIGCYDRATGRFTVVTSDDRFIVSHFASDESYVLLLTDSTYGEQP